MKKFQLREIILVSLVVSFIFVIGYLLLPIMGVLPLPAYRALIVAPIYGAGVTLIARKVRKLGIVTLVGFLIGALLSNFFIWMFFIALIGGLLTDLVILVVFRSYKKDISIAIASGLFPALQLPMTFIIVAYTIGGPSQELLKQPLVILIPTLVAFILGYLPSKGIHQVMKARRL